MRKSEYSYHLLTKGIDTQIKQAIIHNAEQGLTVEDKKQIPNPEENFYLKLQLHTLTEQRNT